MNDIDGQSITRAQAARPSRMDQALGDLKKVIISGDPGTTGISIEPPASAQNSLQ